VQQTPRLFDHLVGESKQLSRFFQSETFFRLEVDHFCQRQSSGSPFAT
jgi:hypothetical protein